MNRSGLSGINTGEYLVYYTKKSRTSGITVRKDISTAEEKDCFLAVLDGSIAACASLYRHDPPVDAFGYAVRNPMRIVRHNIL